MAERLPEFPPRPRPRVEHDFSFLSDGNPWLLVRGVDFEPEVTLASVRRRVREWAERGPYSLKQGYVIETRTVLRDPKRGKTYRELKGIAARDKTAREEYGLAVRLVKDREAAKRRLRRYRGA